jgi:hypothetical protein
MEASIEGLPEFRPGDIVCLSDRQTVEDLLEAGVPNAVNGLSLEVERVRHILQAEGLCDWHLADLSGGPQGQPKLFLLAKCVENDRDLRIYWIPDDFRHPQTRGDLIDAGILWLFEEPADTSNFRPCDLRFTEWICRDTEDGQAEYAVKGGPLHGECFEFPRPPGVLQPQLATVVEYRTETDTDNPEILVLEIGGLDGSGNLVSEGGIVTFFQGANIGGNDISFIKE